MRTTSADPRLLALPLLIVATLALATPATAQIVNDRPSSGSSVRPVAEEPTIAPAPSLRQRIADAIAALQASGRQPASLQRVPARSAKLAWTRRGAR